MTTRTLPRYARATPTRIKFPVAPPKVVEYGYYVTMFYQFLGSALGISLPVVGAAMEAALASYCLMRLGPKAKTVYAPIVLPIGFAVSFVAVQVLAHGEAILSSESRRFIMWIFALIVVQSLTLRRGFLHRFTVVALLIGVSSLPFVSLRAIGGSLGGTLDSESTVGLSHPNVLGPWFGFCCVYFGICGSETREGAVRMVSWLIAAGCLLVVGLTVSRGALLGVALAGTVAFRSLLKRGFAPLLSLILIAGFLSISGIFESSIDSYMQRGTEETGRGEVWPATAWRFLESPLVGFGTSNIGTYIPGGGKARTPHNSVLTIGIAAGIVPLALFTAYWWRAGRGARRMKFRQPHSAAFYSPLFIVAFVCMMLSNYSFMSSWVAVALAAPLAAAYRYPAGRAITRVRRWRAGRFSRVVGATRDAGHFRFDARRPLR